MKWRHAADAKCFRQVKVLRPNREDLPATRMVNLAAWNVRVRIFRLSAKMGGADDFFTIVR